MGISLTAQRLPEKKYSGNSSLDFELLTQKLYLNSAIFEGGYNKSNFLTGRYSEAIANEELSTSFGNYISFGYVLNPISFNLRRASSKFLISDDFYLIPSTEEGIYLNHISWETSIGLNLFPYSDISTYVIPQLGVGYQYSRLCTKCIFEENENHSSLDISSPIWYFSVVINLGEDYYINSAFRQSFSNKDLFTKNQQLSIGLGKRLD